MLASSLRPFATTIPPAAAAAAAAAANGNDTALLHKQACAKGDRWYIHPTSKLLVMTELFHLDRGNCCGNKCLHCPYNHVNVKAKQDADKAAPGTFDSAMSSPSQRTVSLQEPPKKARIYTRTGDKGTSSLFSGERRSKSDACFDALGDIDELSSCIGVAIAFSSEAKHGKLVEMLQQIQQALLDAGSAVATPQTAAVSEAKRARVTFPATRVTQLEAWIDELDSQLPPLTQFILPGGAPFGAQLHVCRSVCRRAERAVVGVLRQYPDSVDTTVQRYLNRLSDLLFTLSRAVNERDQKPEIARSRDQLS